MSFVFAFQNQLLEYARQLMLVNVLLVLLILGFAAAVAVVLVRRNMLRRVEAERLAAMGTATARILHQVKNPLQSILLHAEMLGDERMVAESESRREVSEAIVTGAAQMSSLLEDLSAYASGVTRRLDFQTLSLGELVSDVVETHRRVAEQGRVEVLYGAPATDVMVRADAYFLRQALDNILRNAFDALEDDRERAHWIEVEVNERGGTVLVEVRDTGPGIDPDMLDRVFEPFVTTKGTGMGLGLPICRDIVEGHGGTLDVAPRDGGGTVVSLELPVARVAAAPEPA